MSLTSPFANVFSLDVRAIFRPILRAKNLTIRKPLSALAFHAGHNFCDARGFSPSSTEGFEHDEINVIRSAGPGRCADFG